MIPRAWKRRKPGSGRCGGGGSQARAGGGRDTESSPPAPPARSPSEIPESGARPKWRQRAAEQAAKSSAGAGFVSLGLRGLWPAAFPRLRGARQSRGLSGHRCLPGGPAPGPKPGAPPGASVGALRITQRVVPGGGRAGAAPASGTRESDPGGGGRRQEEGRLRGGGLGPQGRRRLRAGARRGHFDAPPRRREPAVPSAAAATAAASPSQGRGGNSGLRRWKSAALAS